jgi:TetR/AcrR family transcriptional repressor of bet genes
MSTVLKPAGATLDRRRSRSLASRQALVAAAIASIAEHGLSETTLASVSKLAGLSRGLVAFHFESKDALIRAAIAEANRQYETSWRQSVQDPVLPPEQRLAAAIRHDIGFAARRPDLLHLWFAIWGEARAQAIYREQALPMDRRYVEELAGYAAAAGFARREAGDLARLINAFLYGTWLEAHLDSEAFDARSAERAGLRLVAFCTGSR